MILTEQLKDAIEAYLDVNEGFDSLSDIYPIIADLCREKAEHVQTNWQDEECSETWANCFDKHDRVEYLRRHLRTFLGFRELRAAVNGEWYYAANLLPCPSDLIH